VDPISHVEQMTYEAPYHKIVIF